MGAKNELPTADDLRVKLLHESNSDQVELIEEHTRLHTSSLREELEKLRAENERLKSTPGNTQVMLAEAYHRITAENQKLRNALEKIRRWDDELEEEYGDPGELAKEALKGLDQ